MNKFTDEKIEDQLKQLQSIEPDAASLERMNRRVRNLIAESGQQSKLYSFMYYAAASAAFLLIGIGLLYMTNSVQITPPDLQYASAGTPLTLAKLNAVFNDGGQQALNDYFEKIESQRQPRAESVTLQEMLKEL